MRTALLPCLWLALVPACAGDPAAPLDHTQGGASGLVSFRLRSAEPVREGPNELALEALAVGDGLPADGTLSVSALMPSMGHAAAVGEVGDAGPGAFELDVVFSMPGAWELHFVLAGEVEDETTFSLEVP